MNGFGWTAVGAGGAFAALTIAVWRHTDAITAMDVAGHTWAVTSRTAVTISIARAFTQLGSTYVALPIIVVLGYLSLPGRPFRLRAGAAALLGAAAALGAGLGLAVNALVNGVRPQAADWTATAGGPTFPSGHTTVGTILAAAAAWAIWTRFGHLATPSVAVLVAVAAAIGASRVWLGVHWPSDVVGGWLFGLAWAAASVALLNRARRFGERGLGAPVMSRAMSRD